ncbi:MAG: phosphatase PAP2 family protein [Flavobacteriia bacterium]|nr:phosphatase PAP2 family protein [Flavobacteriia bacterium]OJX35118.1 MAG: hypothetical protein BGO87_08135 [Flavobacteriia bacterium 40-80]
MIEYLEHLDQQLLLFLNSLHAPWMDQPMFWISKIKIFIPLFIVWIYQLFQLLKVKAFAFFLMGVALLILLTDQSATITKKTVERYRPTHHLEVGPQVHTVNDYRGGTFGFYSGHAANTFGIAMLLFLTFRKRRTWIKYTFFPFAILASYSRVYLGVHYPSDIFIGMLTGIFYGFLIFQILSLYLYKFFGIQLKQTGD